MSDFCAKFHGVSHDDVIKWKHFPRYWQFVRGIHRSPVNSLHKGQWRGALMFSLICVCMNKRLSKQLWGWWLETLSHPLWRHCNDIYTSMAIRYGLANTNLNLALMQFGIHGSVFQLHYHWKMPFSTLRWRHNDHAGVSNHQPHGCLLNRLFRRNSKKTSKLRVTGLCAGNSPGTGEFPAQMASYAENVSIWWRHHEIAKKIVSTSVKHRSDAKVLERC